LAGVKTQVLQERRDEFPKMKKNRIITLFAAIVTLGQLFLVSGCQTASKYNFEPDPEAYSASYKTFAIMPLPSQISSAEPDLILNGDTVKSTLEDALKSKGYAQVDIDSADFTVSVNGKIVRKFDVSNFEDYPYPTYLSLGRWSYHPPYSNGFRDIYFDEYEEGMLIIEIYDANTGKLVWISWASARLDPKSPNLELIAEKVRSVLNLFPTAQ
jgi:hypothetical protein